MRQLLSAAAALAAVATTAVAALATAPTAAAAAPACPSGTTVVDVSQPVLNDDNAGVAGNAWAGTSYTRRLVIVRTGGHSFCAWSAYNGTFLSNAGTSPGATGFLEAGIAGGYYARWTSNVFSGRFSPSTPTSGVLPAVDFACDAFFNCPGFVDWQTSYFTDVSGFALTYSWQGFDGGTYGRWWHINNASYGDVTG